MTEPLRILVAEDSETDAELVQRELKRGGLDFQSRRVQTEPDFRRELDEFRPDLVISDFSMPQFSGRTALAIARESRADIPFIFISGTIGENVAVEMMKAGADDYVMKNNLARLVPALKRELREAEVRRGRRLAEEGLRRVFRISVAQGLGEVGQDLLKDDRNYLSTDSARRLDGKRFIGSDLDRLSAPSMRVAARAGRGSDAAYIESY